MKLLPLANVLNYKNARVVERFQRRHPQYHDQADELFEDMLRYLWLCKKHEQDRSVNPDHPALQFICVMHEEMRIIDEMWHEFILITKDYAAFCQDYFSDFLHHVPNVNDDMPMSPEQFEQELHLYLSYVYDHLGEATLRRWFSDYLDDE